MRRAATLAPVLAVLVTSLTPSAAHAWGWGDATRGDGKKVSQVRQVGEFGQVRLEGSLDARVTVGPARAVPVTIDQNLQPLVETRLEGDTLVVTAREISYQGEGRVEITVPALRALTIRGSGDARIEGGQGDLALAVFGSGDADWRGEAGRLPASISGSGDMTLAGTASSVEISVAGSGDVVWSGEGRVERAATAGSGRIVHR